MIKSKLVELLKQFEGKDWRAFGNYLNSPYFNKSAEVIALMEFIRLMAEKSFPGSEMERKNVYQVIFPNQPYNDKNLNHLMSQLFKHAERFLSIEAFEQDGILPDYYLLNVYVNRKLDKPYQLAFKRAQKKLHDSPLSG